MSIRIAHNELHTIELPADTLLVDWGSEFVIVSGRDQVPAGHKDLTDTLAGWRRRIPASEPVEMFDAGNDDEIAAIVERLGL